MPTPSDAFIPDALEANRRGELSEKQRHGLGAKSRFRRRDALSIAAFLVAGAAIVFFFASPAAPPLPRTLIPPGCLALAAFLVVRSITGSDALTRDVRDGRLEFVEGPISKTRSGSGGNRTTYSLEVGGRSFKIGRDTYAEAPEAGFVRLYFLPRSRQVVNFERLRDHPVPDVTMEGLKASMEAMFHSPTRSERLEARAHAADLADVVEASFRPDAGTSAHETDGRPLGEAIVGTWKNPLMSVTFLESGRVSIQLPGDRRDGRWSVDRDGRLTADIMGTGGQAGGQQSADAWVNGNQLTINLDGTDVTFTRR